MAKRYIRLKEFIPLTDKFYYPSEEYVASRPLVDINRGCHVKSDKDGFLINDIPKLQDAKEIFVIGGSSVECLYCDFDKRISFLLQEKLLINGYKCICYNMGVSGSTSLNIFNSILNKLIGRSGEIVFFVPSNDAHALQLPRGYLNSHKYFSNILPALDSNNENESFEKNDRLFVSLLRLLKFFCDEFGFGLKVIGIVRNKNNIKFDKLDSLAEKFCVDNNVVFRKIKNYPEESFYDSVHLTPIGASHVSCELYDLVTLGMQKSKENLINVCYLPEASYLNFSLKLSNEILVILDVEVFGDIDLPSLLVAFEFLEPGKLLESECKMMNLRYSKSVGYFRYIKLPSKGKRQVISCKFNLLSRINAGKLIIKKWRHCNKFVIHGAKIYYS